MTTEIGTLATLGSSLNYQPEILQSLLGKKQKLEGVREFQSQLDSVLEQVSNMDGESKLTAFEGEVEAFKGLTENLKTFLSEVPENQNIHLYSKANSVLTDMEAVVSKTSEDLTALKEDEEQGNAQKQEKVFELHQNIQKQVQPLFDCQHSLKDLLQNDLSLVLEESEQAADHFLASIATALFNNILPSESDAPIAAIRHHVRGLCDSIDEQIHRDLDAILHSTEFQTLEANWVGLRGLIESTDWSANVMIDMLDCTKDELGDDLENNSVDLISSDFFKKLYVAEYDQYGGLPYGAIIGLYEFENTHEDRQWLSTMGKIANAAHAPFISAVGPSFFGCKNIEELADIKDLSAHMAHPRFERWQAFRDSEEAAYIGLTVPRFLLRAPYHPENNPGGKGLSYQENINVREGYKDFLWANAALLFTKNMIHSFIQSGWCQYLRGPKGGGLIEHMTHFAFNINGQQELKAPTEMVIPDYRELAFADEGFIPLIYRKGTSDACFFSSQSIKKSKRFKDPKDTENSQLVTNLSYTFSITRIAHYVKCIMRDNIGSAADENYINNVLQTWLSKYVTTVVNPDDRTLRYYPFKAARVVTTPREGMIGWYNSEITVLPHTQFEGMDVELKMDVRI